MSETTQIVIFHCQNYVSSFLWCRIEIWVLIRPVTEHFFKFFILKLSQPTNAEYRNTEKYFTSTECIQCHSINTKVFLRLETNKYYKSSFFAVHMHSEITCTLSFHPAVSSTGQTVHETSPYVY